MVWYVLCGSLLVWLGRAVAQRASGGVVGLAWTVLGEGAHVVVPSIALMYAPTPAQVAWLCIGVLTLAAGLIIARRSAEVVGRATAPRWVVHSERLTAARARHAEMESIRDSLCRERSDEGAHRDVARG